MYKLKETFVQNKSNINIAGHHLSFELFQGTFTKPLMDSEQCEQANCSLINISTCSPLPTFNGNRSREPFYDDEGCFYTDGLRKTEEYLTYMKFSLFMGILTLGRVKWFDKKDLR